MRYVLGVTGGLGKELYNHPGIVGVTRLRCDVSVGSAVERWAANLPTDEPLHVLNATGLSYSNMLHKTEIYGEEWGRMVSVNLLGNARLLRSLRPVFKQQPGSTFTMLGSVTTRTKPVGTAIYTATKSALEGLTRVGACEMAPFARVNLLELGYFNVGMIKQVPDTKKLVERIPLGRLGTPEDLWQAWQFVISCEYVTGAVIPINGGLA